MAATTKLLLIDPNDNLGTGLRVIREREADLITMSEFDDGISDATSTTNPGYVIHEEKVYRIIKTYFDLDNNTRIFLARLDMGAYDYIEEPPVVTFINIVPDNYAPKQGDVVSFKLTILNGNEKNNNGAYFKLTGNRDSETFINPADGTVTIGANEIGTLTVTARPKDASDLSKIYMFKPSKA